MSEKEVDRRIEMILENANLYGLRCEVIATAKAIINDTATSQINAYTQAAYEWDVL